MLAGVVAVHVHLLGRLGRIHVLSWLPASLPFMRGHVLLSSCGVETGVTPGRKIAAEGKKVAFGCEGRVARLLGASCWHFNHVDLGG